MKKSAAVISDIARIFFASAVFCCFFAFFAVISETESARMPLFLPVLCFLLVFVSGRILGKQGMVLLKYTGIEITVIAAGLVIMHLLADIPPDAVRLRMLITLCFVIDAGICAKTAVSENSLSNMVHRFDVCILLFVIMMLVRHYLKTGAADTALIMTFIAFVILLVAVVIMRTGRNSASGSRAGVFIPVIIFAVIIGAALLIGLFGQEGAGSAAEAVTSGIKAFFGAIAAAASFLWRQWTRFCMWLASFFKEREVGPVENIEVVDNYDQSEAVEFSRASVIVLYVLTAMVIIAIITAIVLALKRTRVRKRRSVRIDNRAAAREGSLWTSLRDLILRISCSISYRVCCLRNRNTPAGLLTWCEKKNQRKHRRRPSESGSRYLIRLSETCPKADKDALKKLAGLVEQAFYSTTQPDADEALCRAIHACRF